MVMKRYRNPMGAYTIVGSHVIGPDEEMDVDTDWGYDTSLLEEIKIEKPKAPEPVVKRPEDDPLFAGAAKKARKKTVIDDEITEE